MPDEPKRDQEKAPREMTIRMSIPSSVKIQIDEDGDVSIKVPVKQDSTTICVTNKKLGAIKESNIFITVEERKDDFRVTKTESRKRNHSLTSSKAPSCPTKHNFLFGASKEVDSHEEVIGGVLDEGVAGFKREEIPSTDKGVLDESVSDTKEEGGEGEGGKIEKSTGNLLDDLQVRFNDDLKGREEAPTDADVVFFKTFGLEEVNEMPSTSANLSSETGIMSFREGPAVEPSFTRSHGVAMTSHERIAGPSSTRLDGEPFLGGTVEAPSIIKSGASSGNSSRVLDAPPSLKDQSNLYSIEMLLKILFKRGDILPSYCHLCGKSLANDFHSINMHLIKCMVKRGDVPINLTKCLHCSKVNTSVANLYIHHCTKHSDKA